VAPLCSRPVSTHASAREATSKTRSTHSTDPVSTHASAREATALGAALRRSVHRFYPRLREGGDPPCVGACCPGRVSTHASAREATELGRQLLHGLLVSTHASAREATVSGWSFPTGSYVSTHASAREATTEMPYSVRSLLFLPTPPRGRRPRRRQGKRRLWSVSTHASAREATFVGFSRDFVRRGFYPRLREGGDFRGF